jgi:ligand-binding SRPBCC domain-containing protein
MTSISLQTLINAPAEICFDLMRDVRLHVETTVQTNEKAVAGVTSDKIGLGQTVTFEGIHFGMRQRLTVKVVEFDRPNLFVDEMIEGRFRSFRHVHEFGETELGTLMTDTIEWTSPLGPIGRIVDRLFIAPHLRKLVTGRNSRLKELAETSVLQSV